jgi:hypothetical protein
VIGRAAWRPHTLSAATYRSCTLQTPSSARTEAYPELKLDNPGSADSMAGDALKKYAQFPHAASTAPPFDPSATG